MVSGMGRKTMTRDELLALIDRAAAEGWTELNLFGAGLTEIPEAVAQLHSLQKLHLRGNSLPISPEVLSEPDNVTGIFNYSIFKRDVNVDTDKLFKVG